MVRLAGQGALIDLEVIALDEHTIGRQKVSYRPFQARTRGYGFMGLSHLCFSPPFPGDVLSSEKVLGNSLLSASSFEGYHPHVSTALMEQGQWLYSEVVGEDLLRGYEASVSTVVSQTPFLSLLQPLCTNLRPS